MLQHVFSESNSIFTQGVYVVVLQVNGVRKKFKIKISAIEEERKKKR